MRAGENKGRAGDTWSQRASSGDGCTRKCGDIGIDAAFRHARAISENPQLLKILTQRQGGEPVAHFVKPCGEDHKGIDQVIAKRQRGQRQNHDHGKDQAANLFGLTAGLNHGLHARVTPTRSAHQRRNAEAWTRARAARPD